MTDEIKKAAPKKAPAKKVKTKAPMIVNGRIVVESKTPLHSANHKKGTSPYKISEEEVKVTLVKSACNSIKVHKATVEALGLKKIGQSKTFKKSPALYGMLFRVQHLIKVEEVTK